MICCCAGRFWLLVFTGRRREAMRQAGNEAGRQWCDIAQTLRQSTTVKFKPSLSQRAVRERFALLQARFKQKERTELAASGISPDDPDELDMLLEDIAVREKDASQAEDEKKKGEKAIGEDIRMQALERMGQTKKRKRENENDEKTEKRRRSSNEALEFLQAKAESETSLRKEELKIKKMKEENKSGMFEAMEKQQQSMLKALKEQQEKQEKQSQSMQALMAQQNQAIISLLGKFVPKQPE